MNVTQLPPISDLTRSIFEPQLASTLSTPFMNAPFMMQAIHRPFLNESLPPIQDFGLGKLPKLSPFGDVKTGAFSHFFAQDPSWSPNFPPVNSLPTKLVTPVPSPNIRPELPKVVEPAQSFPASPTNNLLKKRKLDDFEPGCFTNKLEAKAEKKKETGERSTPQKWTAAEDAELKRLVKEIPKCDDRWTRIAKRIKGKTASQCFQHWERVLNPVINKKPWTVEEEELLLKLIDEASRQGNQQPSWAKIAEKIEGRTDTQIRYKYHTCLKSQATPWSRDEDALLLDTVRKNIKKGWVTLSLDFFKLARIAKSSSPRRSALDCKQRYEYLIATAEPKPDLRKGLLN